MELASRLIAVCSMTIVLLALSGPVLVGLFVVAVVAHGRGALRHQPLGGPVSLRWGLGVAILATLAWGAALGNFARQPAPDVPPSALGVLALFTLQVALGVMVVRRARRRRAAVAAIVVTLWVGLVASWASWWAVAAGGTFGAL